MERGRGRPSMQREGMGLGTSADSRRPRAGWVTGRVEHVQTRRASVRLSACTTGMGMDRLVGGREVHG